MRFCIHRGAKEIGGNCVEIESQGKRLVLDIGLPLDAELEDTPLPSIKGLAEADPSLLGIVISHPHQDHYGLAHKVRAEVPILIGPAAQRILEVASIFTPGGISFQNIIPLQDRAPIAIGPFTITPYLMDHSAYDSYAVLVEAEGNRLFYSGDFRAHGRKGKLFRKLLRDPPKGVDVLLMEGTNLGREDAQAIQSEDDLEKEFIRHFKAAKGLVLVYASGQNIDRLVTIFRACLRTGKQFIVDMYTAAVLEATGNANIPQHGFKNLRVYLPSRQKWKIIETRSFDLAKRHRSCRIFPEELADEALRSVMLFRPSMRGELAKAKCLADATLIYSLWRGYLDRQDGQRLQEWLMQQGIILVQCHTSGHAAVKELKKLGDAMSPKDTIVIHTAVPVLAAEQFGCSTPGSTKWVQVPKYRRVRAWARQSRNIGKRDSG
jgi:ribonuclease J